jgi:hypothetical protein
MSQEAISRWSLVASQRQTEPLPMSAPLLLWLVASNQRLGGC